MFKKMSYRSQKNTSVLSRLSLISVFLAFSVSVSAASVKESIGEKLKLINENIVIDTLEETPWPGMYEIVLKSGDVLFSDKNAEYLVLGQMFNLSKEKGFINLSALKQEKKVAQVLSNYGVDKQIVYAAKGEQKAEISVFTDITCFYCQKLHKAVPELQENGVTVKYMAFPRAGEHSDVAQQMSAIWCAKDPAQALTDAKQKGKIATTKCDSPVGEQYLLAQQLGVNATPTIFTENGKKIAGFASAQDLLNSLGIN